MSFRFCIASAVLAALPALASAQESATQTPPVFPIGLDVVNLTTTVWNKDRRLVNDIRPEEFVIYEDGRPQKLQVFGRAYATDDSQATAQVRVDTPQADSVVDATDDMMAIDLGMMMDTSESMVKELKLAQEAATRFLEAIPRARDLLTVFFDQDILVSRYDSEQQQGLFDRIHSIKGGGQTALRDAIAVYLSRIEAANGRQILVLFTDGEDSRSDTTLTDVITLVRSSGVTVFPISFAGSLPQSRATQPKAFLQDLAAITGGEVFAPSRSADLALIFRRILDQLRCQYVLGFVSDNPARDGKYRKLKVEVKRKDLKVRHREGYRAPDDTANARGR